MFTRELKRFLPVLGLERRIPLRFQKVVEELHVQLVIFDDKNGLRH